MRINLQPSYILHSRPYRDTSVLLEVLTAEYGRISLVARGVRRQSRKGSQAALLQPFIPQLLSFSGRTDLKTLTATEPAGAAVRLLGNRLFSGMYLNELLVRLMHRHDAHPRLFVAYTNALEALVSDPEPDAGLRRFELVLLDELGYRLDLDTDADSGRPVQGGTWYRFDPGIGLVESRIPSEKSRRVYRGGDLLAMANGELGGEARSCAKYLLREALSVHLGDAPLHSRDLFRARSAPAGAPAPLVDEHMR